MSATFLTVDAANLFIGDEQPEDGRYLKLKNVNFPDLEEGTRDIKPAGAAAGVSIGDRTIMPLSIRFSLDGFNLDDVQYFMQNNRFTIRGSIRNLRTTEDSPVIGIVNGRMTKITQSDMGKDGDASTEYEVNEITFYELKQNGAEKLYFDWFAGYAGVRRNGRPMFDGVARNLGVV